MVAALISLTIGIGRDFARLNEMPWTWIGTMPGHEAERVWDKRWNYYADFRTNEPLRRSSFDLDL